VAYQFLPLLGGAVLVALASRHNWLPVLARPIDNGRTLRGRRLLGDHKTWRGVLAGGVGTALVMVAQARVLHHVPAARALEYVDYATIAPWRLGFALGVARMLGELPNSFLKRQLGVPSGSAGRAGWRPVLYCLDRLDYLPAIWLVAGRRVPVSARRVLLSVAVVFLVHTITNVVGYRLGMRRAAH
jgi:CDP-2,3-bis-(O-geranylgeranyl)-sn-glycerol synthase